MRERLERRAESARRAVVEAELWLELHAPEREPVDGHGPQGQRAPGAHRLERHG